MDPIQIFLLSTSPDLDVVVELIKRFRPNLTPTIISNRIDWEKHRKSIKGRVILLSYDNGIIIPEQILDGLDFPAYNFHPAPPEYPGRDPYHFAIFDSASTYGATLHKMTEKVDDGTIVDVERFDISHGSRPGGLLREARDRMLVMFKRHGDKLLSGSTLTALEEKWASNKTTRADFLKMCRIPNDINNVEFERRFNAFDGENHNNLVVEIHGRRFRIEKESLV